MSELPEKVKELLASLKAAKESVKLVVKDLAAALEEKIITEFRPFKPNFEIYAIDGGFRSFRAFVNDLVIYRVAVIRSRVEDQRLEVNIEHRELEFSYGYDPHPDGEALAMLKRETDKALEVLSKKAPKDVLLIDGPLINPPLEYKELVSEEYYKKRERLLREDVYGIVKRHRRAFLQRYVEEKYKESFLLIELLNEIRSSLEDPLGPVAIGPFEHNGVYARYVQRTIAHKPVLLESVVPEFPQRIMHELIWPPSARASAPAPLEIAHEFAHVSEDVAENFSSIIYRLLRIVE